MLVEYADLSAEAVELILKFEEELKAKTGEEVILVAYKETADE
jgi:hypothetical protein